MEKIRLQKYMADCGIAARRKCEEMIEQGRVLVNGNIAELGCKVDGGEKIEVDGKIIGKKDKKVYLLLNKPVGYLSSASDDRGRFTVTDLVKDEIKERVFPVGRLDFDSEGMLILTNDGDFSYKLTHPKHHIYKKYIVTLDKIPALAAIERMKRGVEIDGRRTAPAKVEFVRDNILEFQLLEGRNRQIRKMCEAVGYKVVQLKRVAIGNIVLGNLPLGRFRHLSPGEVNYLKGKN